MLGPKINIISPKNGDRIESETLVIRGETKNVTSLSLDGRTIFTDEKGLFQERLLLYSGYNILELKARDRFGREIKKILELVY